MGRILVPHKELIVPDSTFKCPTVRMGGFMRCQTHKYKSGTLKNDSGWFPNVITDKGIGYYANAPTSGGSHGWIFNQCAVGTGTGTPTTSDSGLFTYLTSTATNPGGFASDSTAIGYTPSAGGVPPYYWNQNQFIFGTGQAAGNLTEIGVYPAYVAYGSGLFSHALIVDANGNPTSITVLADEVLTVTYQVNYYIDVNDHNFSFPYNGSTTTGVYRTCNMGTVPPVLSHGGWQGGSFQQPIVSFYSGDIAALNTNPSGQLAVSNDNQYPGTFSNWTNDLANSGTWYFDYLVTFPTGVGTGTAKSMTYQKDWINYQFGQLSQPIVKNSGQQLQVSFRASWGRYP